MIRVFAHLLPWPADPSVPSMRRSALEAVPAAPFGLVRVSTTHLEYRSQVQLEQQVDRPRELHAEAAAHRAITNRYCCDSKTESA